jgi:hypothetical protein
MAFRDQSARFCTKRTTTPNWSPIIIAAVARGVVLVRCWCCRADSTHHCRTHAVTLVSQAGAGRTMRVNLCVDSPTAGCCAASNFTSVALVTAGRKKEVHHDASCLRRWGAGNQPVVVACPCQTSDLKGWIGRRRLSDENISALADILLTTLGGCYVKRFPDVQLFPDHSFPTCMTHTLKKCPLPTSHRLATV